MTFATDKEPRAYSKHNICFAINDLRLGISCFDADNRVFVLIVNVYEALLQRQRVWQLSA
jgi:hypothetical protein